MQVNYDAKCKYHDGHNGGTHDGHNGIHDHMTEEELITAILDEAFYVHRKLGPGLLESVYKTCLAHRLRLRGLKVEVEKPIPVFFDDVKMDCGFRADILVENLIVVETKSIEAIAPKHTATLLTYLRFLGLRFGLMLNFDVFLLRDGIKRVLNGFGKAG